MAEILVLRHPGDEIFDRISVDDDSVGERVQEVFDKLSKEYSIEVLYDASPRAES